jgi:Ca2+-binding EF-hand superfamily protein
MRGFLAIMATLMALTSTAWAQTPAATGVPDSRLVERFRQADTNGDGLITDDEARAAGLRFTQDFKSVDIDGSGTVTLFELGQALQRRVSRWLSDRDSADTNHDGQLTEDKAARAPSIAEAFKTMGRNNDRAVTRDEYESYAIDRMSRDSELPYVAPNIIEKRF